MVGGACSTYGLRVEAYTGFFLGGGPDGKRALGRPRRR